MLAEAGAWVSRRAAGPRVSSNFQAGALQQQNQLTTGQLAQGDAEVDERLTLNLAERRLQVEDAHLGRRRGGTEGQPAGLGVGSTVYVSLDAWISSYFIGIQRS